ncbi:MAG: hypothetical protein ACLRHD_00330 [Thomasclavelia spiroformis]
MKPLSNQKYYVLDNHMNDCPDWVPGNLYIAGDGVAKGYINSKELTDRSFITRNLIRKPFITQAMWPDTGQMETLNL